MNQHKEPAAITSSSRSLQKLHAHLVARGSPVTADNYVDGARRFAEWAGAPPDDLIARAGKDWGELINDYITNALQAGKSARIIQRVVQGTKKWLVANNAAKTVTFQKMPTMISVRASLSKASTSTFRSFVRRDAVT